MLVNTGASCWDDIAIQSPAQSPLDLSKETNPQGYLLGYGQKRTPPTRTGLSLGRYLLGLLVGFDHL